MYRSLFTYLISFVLCFYLSANIASADATFDDLFKMPKINNSNDGNAASSLPFTGICAYKENNKIKCSIKLDAGSYIYRDSLLVKGDNADTVLSSIPDGTSHTDLNGTTSIIDTSFDVEITVKRALKGDYVYLFTEVATAQASVIQNKK